MAAFHHTWKGSNLLRTDVRTILSTKHLQKKLLIDFQKSVDTYTRVIRSPISSWDDVKYAATDLIEMLALLDDIFTKKEQEEKRRRDRAAAHYFSANN